MKRVYRSICDPGRKVLIPPVIPGGCASSIPPGIEGGFPPGIPARIGGIPPEIQGRTGGIPPRIPGGIGGIPHLIFTWVLNKYAILPTQSLKVLYHFNRPAIKATIECRLDNSGKRCPNFSITCI